MRDVADATELTAVFLDGKSEQFLATIGTRGAVVSKGRSWRRSSICVAQAQQIGQPPVNAIHGVGRDPHQWSNQAGSVPTAQRSPASAKVIKRITVWLNSVSGIVDKFDAEDDRGAGIQAGRDRTASGIYTITHDPAPADMPTRLR